MKRNARAAIACFLLSNASVYSQPVQFIVYDGKTYPVDRIMAAASSPIIQPPPKVGDVYSVPRSVDGHYYIPGFVNGFPVTFMVDTGAAYTTLPIRHARNAGLRAGRVVSFEGASGRVRGSLTEGNAVVFSTFMVAKAPVAILEELQTPLLGADVLNRFQITYAEGRMLVRIPR